MPVTNLFDNDPHHNPISVRVRGHHHDMVIVGFFHGHHNDGFVLRVAIAYMATSPDVPGPTTTDLLEEVWIPREAVRYVTSAIKGEVELLDAAVAAEEEAARHEYQAQAGLVDLT